MSHGNANDEVRFFDYSKNWGVLLIADLNGFDREGALIASPLLVWEIWVKICVESDVNP